MLLQSYLTSVKNITNPNNKSFTPPNYCLQDRLKDVLYNMGTEKTICNNYKWKVTLKFV